MVDQASPSSLDSHLGFWLRFVSNQVSIRFQKLLEEKGVTVTEWVAMRTLWDHPSTNYAILIEVLGMTKGAVSKVMQRLEEKGYAERKFAEGRAREQLLVLTELGREMVPKLSALADANDAFFFSHLPDLQHQSLLSSLKALVNHHQLKKLPTT